MILSFTKKILAHMIVSLRPLLGPASCYFEERCTPFALRMLEEKSLLMALFAIIKRIFSCNPLTAHCSRKNLLAFICLLGISVPSFALNFTTASYVATSCDPDLIRKETVIQSFLKKAAVAMGSNLKGSAMLFHNHNGYFGTQHLYDSGMISVIVDNSCNKFYLHISLLDSFNKAELIALIKEYFKARSVIKSS